MKIGLILSHTGINYGMLLQAYATQKYVESKGVQTEIIRIRGKQGLGSKLKQYTRYLSPVALKAALKKAKRRRLVKNDPVLRAAFHARTEVGLSFAKNRLQNINIFSSLEHATEYARQNYSCVMIGSDQQWAPACFYSKLNTLMFVPDGVKRVSYATSMGVSQIPVNTHGLLKNFISKMDHVSVREETGKNIITDVTGREDVQVVPDPTFLLTADQWRQYIPVKKPNEENYVFCYFLGNSNLPVKKVISWARQAGLKAIFVRNVESYSSEKVEYEDATVLDAPTVDEFINYIRHASLVCTDSFHCTVFSLINNVPFATFYRTESSDKDSRNSRIDNLLEHYECANRICRDDAQMQSVVDTPLNFDRINQIIASTRAIGERFLEEILYE